MVNRFIQKIFVLPYLMRDAAFEFKRDNYQKAIEIYMKVIGLFPRHYDAHLWAGTAYSAIEQNESAVNCYKNAIKINAKGFDAYLNYSKLEMRENRYQKSLDLLLKAIEFYPVDANGFSDLYYQKGLLEYYLYNYYEALASFNKSLELSPDNAYAQNGKTIAAEGILCSNNIKN